MANFMPSFRSFPALAIALLVLILPVHAQTSIPCTSSMLTSFTPCINYITNSTSTRTSPTTGCCDSIKTIMSNGTECMCLIATGNIPFQIPINRTLAISLPRACKMAGVPLQCKASAAPISAPGPIAFSPIGPPSPLSPTGSSLSPEADTNPSLTPPSTTVGSAAPTANSGSRPVLTPSAAEPSLGFSPALLLTLLGAVALKYYY